MGYREGCFATIENSGPPIRLFRHHQKQWIPKKAVSPPSESMDYEEGCFTTIRNNGFPRRLFHHHQNQWTTKKAVSPPSETMDSQEGCFTTIRINGLPRRITSQWGLLVKDVICCFRGKERRQRLELCWTLLVITLYTELVRWWRC